jgi:hypothetical protein
MLGNRKYRYPLTITDYRSRYLPEVTEARSRDPRMCGHESGYSEITCENSSVRYLFAFKLVQGRGSPALPPAFPRCAARRLHRPLGFALFLLAE